MQRRQYGFLQMEDAAAWAVELKPSGRNSDSSSPMKNMVYWTTSESTPTHVPLGNLMPESTLTLGQSRFYPPVRD